MPAKKTDEPELGSYDAKTMGRPEDGEGLTRWRAEDGALPKDADAVVLVTPERGDDSALPLVDPNVVPPTEPAPDVSDPA